MGIEYERLELVANTYFKNLSRMSEMKCAKHGR